MPEISYVDFDPNGQNGNENEWVTVQVGKPDEKLVWLRMKRFNDMQAMSNRRNIYKSADQGVTWEFDRRAGYLEYWAMRARDKWSDLRIVAKWLLNRIRLWWWAKRGK